MLLWIGLPLLIAGVAGWLPALLALGRTGGAPAEAFATWNDGLLWLRLSRTLGLAGLTLALALPGGWALAWLLTRTDLPGQRGLLLLLPLPLFLPPLVHVLTWYGALGLKGAPAIVLVYTISFTPLVAMLCARALALVGRERQETALLLGGRRAAWEDEVRQSLPAALAGGALTLILVLSDFAVADFLTAVGPKITVYADSLYRHHLGSTPAATAAAALPGLALGLGALLIAGRLHRRLGATVGGRFTPAPPLALGRARWWCALATWGWILGCALGPIGVLAWQMGSIDRFLAQAAAASGRIGFSLLAGAGAATGMVALALPLAWAARRARRRFWLDLAVGLPLAIPALLHGIGLIQFWNRPGLDGIYLGIGLVWIALAGRYLVFAYLPLGAVVDRLEERLIEAARLAGAGALRRAWHLILPWTRDALLGAWCLAFCFALRELDTLILLRAGQRSLTFHLHANVVFAAPDDVAAIALLVILSTYLPWALYLGLVRRPLSLW
jgi:iron(III) transport system permease protein